MGILLACLSEKKTLCDKGFVKFGGKSSSVTVHSPSFRRQERQDHRHHLSAQPPSPVMEPRITGAAMGGGGLEAPGAGRRISAAVRAAGRFPAERLAPTRLMPGCVLTPSPPPPKTGNVGMNRGRDITHYYLAKKNRGRNQGGGA